MEKLLHVTNSDKRKAESSHLAPATKIPEHCLMLRKHLATESSTTICMWEKNTEGSTFNFVLFHIHVSSAHCRKQ